MQLWDEDGVVVFAVEGLGRTPRLVAGWCA